MALFSDCQACQGPLAEADTALCGNCLASAHSQNTQGLPHTPGVDTLPPSQPGVGPTNTTNCIDGCKFGNDARYGIIKCIWCPNPQGYHKKCLGVDVYICEKCRNMPSQIENILTMMTGLVDAVGNLSTNNAKLNDTMTQQSNKIASLETH